MLFRSHETVLIQGSGPIGIFCAAVAKDHGAKQVLMIGAPAPRLETAKKFGVDACINLDVVKDAKDRRQWVRDQTGGRGADIVFQCATNAAVPEGLNLLRGGGRFVNIGVGGGRDLLVERDDLGKRWDIDVRE